MQSHKISFLSLLFLILLLPIFFLPASILSLGMSKVLLLAVGVLIALFAVLIGVLKNGSIKIPSTYLMWSVLLIPLVYFLSAFFGSDRTYSLFGYYFEVGTFGLITFTSLLFGLVAYVFSTTRSIVQALRYFFTGAGLLSLFAVVKIVSNGTFPVWGTFTGNMGNPIGSWTDYGIFFGIMALLSALALSVLSHKPVIKGILYTLFFVDMALMAVINFSTAWTMTLLASIIVLVYLLTVEKKIVSEHSEMLGSESRKTVIWPVIILAVIALLFVVNPVVSSRGNIGTAVSGMFGVSNIDVRPSFSTTLGIAKDALGENPILGSGPNTFNRDWLNYKPQEVNGSIFWNVSFPFGFGFVPTQIASVGALGTLVWLLFLTFFLITGAKAFAHIPRDGWGRFSLVSTFLVSLFIWIASFLYVPSAVILSLAFFFSGLFIASAKVNGIIAEREIVFSKRIVTNFAMALLIIAVGIGAAALGLFTLQRTVSAYHYQKAIALSNEAEPSLDKVETSLQDAVSLVPLDIYYVALSQINVVRARNALNATTGTSEENSKAFQTAVSNSIAASQLATQVGPLNYENWIGLGSIFSSLVPSPFSVEGAYEEAERAFTEAKKLNPTSPEIPLLLARLELDNNNVDKAREYINESIALKADYADAYFLLTQLEIGQNNVTEATRSAETTALLSPNNAGVFLQLGLLRYSSNNWEGARAAFEQALVILPDYANAKYYLGLTLAKLKQNERAVALFADLQKTNPDNQEIAIILENLENGRDPLKGIPQNSSDIRQRENPPVKEN